MKETTEKKEGITLEDYLEYWYYNNYLPTSTSSSTDAYYRWMIFSVIEPNLPAMGLPVEKTYAIFLNALLERVSIKSENTAASLYRFLRILITNGLGNKIENPWLFLDLKNYSAIEKVFLKYGSSCLVLHLENSPLYHNKKINTHAPMKAFFRFLMDFILKTAKKEAAASRKFIR